MGLVCALAAGTTGAPCEAETFGTATVQIVSIYIISTSITAVNNSSNLIHRFLCCLGNRDSIPMDFMPGIGRYSSHVHRIAVQAVINCIKSGISDKSTQMGAFLGLGLGRHGVSSAMKVRIGHQTHPSSSRALLCSVHRVLASPLRPLVSVPRPPRGFCAGFPQAPPAPLPYRQVLPLPAAREEGAPPHLGNTHRCQRTCRPLLGGEGSPFLGARSPGREAGLAFLSPPRPPSEPRAPAVAGTGEAAAVHPGLGSGGGRCEPGRGREPGGASFAEEEECRSREVEGRAAGLSPRIKSRAQAPLCFAGSLPELERLRSAINGWAGVCLSPDDGCFCTRLRERKKHEGRF